jgi:tetratricopeptide (TPR) repeat protein
MKKFIWGFVLLFFSLFPVLSFSTDNDKKEPKNQQIMGMKPDEKLSEEQIISGKQLIENYQFEKAQLSFKKALLHNPFSGEAYYCLGYCYKRLGLYDKAEKELEIGLKYDRIHESLVLLGLIYKYEGKYPRAKDLFLEVLSKKPDNKEVNTYLKEMEKVDKELMIKGN